MFYNPFEFSKWSDAFLKQEQQAVPIYYPAPPPSGYNSCWILPKIAVDSCL